MIGINKWISSDLTLDLLRYPPNTTFGYNKTLEKIKISEDFMVSRNIHDMRKSAECHRQARRYIQDIIKPGIKIYDVCTKIENKIVELFKENNLHSGIGFPVGLSINNVSAHDSAFPKSFFPTDNRVIGYDDICKIDFGTHYNQFITDSAFTVAFNPKFKPLIDAAKDGMWTGIKNAGPDAIINEISASIKETIESYEIELDGNTHQIHSSKNLGGHTLKKGIIHAGKLLLGCPNQATQNMRMMANEIWAVEVFPTTGSGNMYSDNSGHTCHYMINSQTLIPQFKYNSSKKLYSYIKNKRGTLPFCTRWLEKYVGQGYKLGLKDLMNKNILSSFPPLLDHPGTYSSQFEHTIYLHDYGKEVLSHGDDY
jgi:methionyl aminopeptidase